MTAVTKAVQGLLAHYRPPTFRSAERPRVQGVSGSRPVQEGSLERRRGHFARDFFDDGPVNGHLTVDEPRVVPRRGLAVRSCLFAARRHIFRWLHTTNAPVLPVRSPRSDMIDDDL